MICINCNHYDMNDPVHCYGTCEPQEIDFRCDHECNLNPKEFERIHKEIVDLKNFLRSR